MKRKRMNVIEAKTEVLAKKLSATRGALSLIKKLRDMGSDLPFKANRAWKSSSVNIAGYVLEHADNGTGLDFNQSAMMAAGRLDWLLREARPTLSGLFSEEDIATLAKCFEGNIFCSDQIDSIASDFCDRVGIEFRFYSNSSIGSLTERLLSLSPVQRVTLADALEQMRYHGMKVEGMRPTEFLESLGISLR